MDVLAEYFMSQTRPGANLDGEERIGRDRVKEMTTLSKFGGPLVLLVGHQLDPSQKSRVPNSCFCRPKPSLMCI